MFSLLILSDLYILFLFFVVYSCSDLQLPQQAKQENNDILYSS